MSSYELNKLITSIEGSPRYPSDPCLQKISEILKTCNTPATLAEKKKLIERMVVDGVSDYTVGEKILSFLKEK